MTETACVFCEIIAGTAPATIVREWPDAIAFRPLGPVVEGHILVVPRQHVANAVEKPVVTAATMTRAAQFAAQHGASNILTSTGRAATQSIFHLHIHVIPRATEDQLMVPWGTTGDPQAPHQCKRTEAAEATVARVEALAEKLEGAKTFVFGKDLLTSMLRRALDQPEENAATCTCSSNLMSIHDCAVHGAGLPCSTGCPIHGQPVEGTAG